MISVVVPTLNAASTLGGCLGALGAVDELLIVDGGSTDSTREIAGAFGARIVEAPRGRGTQLQAGGAEAQGDWLLFLHADTRLGAGWREAAERHIVLEPGKAACFRLRLDDRAWQARVVEAAVTLRARWLALPYGDQALLLSRRLYQEAGGYRPLPLMEDVDLVRRIGRRRLARLPVTALTSAQRWRRDGWLRRSARNLACLALYRAGMSPDRVARFYG